MDQPLRRMLAAAAVGAGRVRVRRGGALACLTAVISGILAGPTWVPGAAAAGLSGEGVPVGPRLEVGWSGAGRVKLRWQAASGNSRIDVESATALGGVWEVVPGSALTTVFADGWVTAEDVRPAGAGRFYRLRRTDTGGQGVREPSYDIGAPVWRDVWVDGAAGEDYDDTTHDGATRARAFRTLGRAWRSLPESGAWETAYRIRLAPGTYRGAYLEDRRGAAATPVLIEPADGAGTVSFTPLNGDGGNLTFYQASHVILQDLVIDVSSAGGDGIQFERCDHVLLRRMTVRSRRSDEQNETVKVNQSQHVYLEDSEISGAGDNAIDMVGVQYGHIVRCRIHDTQDWGAYLKGGSAYFLVEGNEIFNCGTGGFTAGQGSGLQFMVPPWIHYEAYDVRVVNNIIHDTEGAGLGVNGGFNILMAHNTLYRVGSRSHVMEFVFGGRSCDGLDVGRCQPLLDQGAWGQLTDEGGYGIPNRNVLVANNVIHNPAPFRSQWQHLQVAGAAMPQEGFVGPDAPRGDTGLVLTGNVVWNGAPDMPLGIEGGAACPPGHGGCDPEHLRSANHFNDLEPDFVAAGAGDFRPAPGGRMASLVSVELPPFAWSSAPTRPEVPAGGTVNTVTRDYLGRPRTAGGPPGAVLP